MVGCVSKILTIDKAEPFHRRYTRINSRVSSGALLGNLKRNLSVTRALYLRRSWSISCRLMLANMSIFSDQYKLISRQYKGAEQHLKGNIFNLKISWYYFYICAKCFWIVLWKNHAAKIYFDYQILAAKKRLLRYLSDSVLIRSLYESIWK